MSARSTSELPALQVVDLTKHYGRFSALDGVTLSVAESSTHAVIGPNGAGKSTLFNIVSGHLHPDSGTILLGERNITRRNAWQRARLGIGKAFQVPQLFDDMTIGDSLALAVAVAVRGTTLTHMAIRRPQLERARLQDAADKLGLDRRQSVAALSQGDRKRLEIAIAMVLSPHLLLLDEPTAGMPANEAHAIMDSLSELVKEQGISLLLIEHDMDLVFRLCDQITVLHEGKTLFTGAPEEVRQDDAVAAAYLGA